MRGSRQSLRRRLAQRGGCVRWLADLVFFGVAAAGTAVARDFRRVHLRVGPVAIGIPLVLTHSTDGDQGASRRTVNR